MVDTLPLSAPTAVANVTPEALQSPSKWKERRFLQTAFAEASEAPFDGRVLQGPNYPDFMELLQHVDTLLLKIDPGLTPEHLKPQAYRPYEVAYDFDTYGKFENVRGDVESLRYHKRMALRQIGIQLGIEASENPAAVVRSLDTTPYLYQGDTFPKQNRFYNSQRTCFNACFRMVFAGITGITLTEHKVQDAIEQYHHNDIVEDEEYLKIFTSETFYKRFQTAVQTISITGAELSTINQIAQKFRDRGIGKRIFATVSLGSEATNGDIWHTNVLVGADSESVTVHDPSFSRSSRAQNRKLPKEYFYTRWAQAYNRVHMFIVS